MHRLKSEFLELNTQHKTKKNVRSAEYFEGAAGVTEAEQLHIRDGLRHLERALLLWLLHLLIWHLVHHQRWVSQVLWRGGGGETERAHHTMSHFFIA